MSTASTTFNRNVRTYGDKNDTTYTTRTTCVPKMCTVNEDYKSDQF